MDSLLQAGYNVYRREIIQDTKWPVIIPLRVEFVFKNWIKAHRLKVCFRFVRWNPLLYKVSILDQSVKYIAFSYPSSYKSLLLVYYLHSQYVQLQLFSFCIKLTRFLPDYIKSFRYWKLLMQRGKQLKGPQIWECNSQTHQMLSKQDFRMSIEFAVTSPFSLLAFG